MVPQFTPFGVGSLPLPQLPLRGASPISPPLLLPLHSPDAARPTRLLGVPPVPLGVHGPHRCLVDTLVVKRCEFHILLVHHLDSTSLHWVFVAVHGFSLVAGSRGCSSLWCTGFSLQWLLLLWSRGSRRTGFSSCGRQAQ